MPLHARAVTAACRACFRGVAVVVVVISIMNGVKMGGRSSLSLVDGRVPEHIALLSSEHQWIRFGGAFGA